MMRLIQNAVLLLLVASVASTASAADVYWDINGSTAGVGEVGGFNDGVWDAATLNWNPSADGTGTTQAWLDGDHAHFSAGTDATDGIVSVSGGAKNLGSLTIEEGIVEFQGANNTVVLGTNPARINQGATLRMPVTGFSIVQILAGQVLTMDGGALQSQITGIGSGVWSGLGTIELTSNGGKVITGLGPSNAYSIMSYTGTVNLTAGTTTATFTKTGPSELRLRNQNKFTTLDIQEGLLRADSTGGQDQSFGAPTGLVKIGGGAVENSTNGAAIGTSIGMTGANASPATRSFELTGVGANTDSMFVTNASWTINGPISGNGGLMLNGWARNDGGGAPNIIGGQTAVLQLGGTNTYAGPTTINFATLAAAGGSAIPNNSRVTISTRSDWGGNLGSAITTLNTAVLRIDASETIGSLAGGNATRGSVNINGAAVTLTAGADNTSSTYSGTITGTGGLAKTGDGTFTMDGVKSYTGNTSALDGVLSTNSASLADAADVFLATGGVFNLNFAGTDVIDSLFIDGASQAIGTWGGAGSGAANISALLSGTGLLQVSTTVSTGVNGDFNNDGKVDAADYTVWRDNLDSTTALPHDNNLGTPIGQAHYDLWKANFGLMAGSGSLAASAVPEPSTALLFVVAILGFAAGRRRK